MSDVPPIQSFFVPKGTVQGNVVEHWPCLACDRVIPIVHRPGRPRLYCTHACRQRAYRWRRDHQARTAATAEHPAAGAYARSHVPLRNHALRTQRDPISRRNDSRHREVTVCGVLARPNRFGQLGRTFRPDASERTCQVCAELTTIRPFEPHHPIDHGSLGPPAASGAGGAHAGPGRRTG